MINLSRRIAQQHDVLLIKIIHGWKDFVELHDYDKLLDVYDSFLAIDYSAHKYMEEQIKTMGYLASAIFKKETREDDFTQAEKHALAITEMTPPIQTTISYSIHAIKSSEAFCHLVRLFRNIIRANEGDTKASLRKAWLESKAMSESIAKIDPLNKFALKTEILHSLISEDLLSTQKACKRLKEQSLGAPLIGRFINNVEKWLLESKRLKGRRFLVRVGISESDPWERLFRKIVYTNIHHDLDRHIAGMDAVVFVEGVSDAKILEQIAQKLVPDKKLLFMDVEGFTNMNYYSEAKLAKKLGVPLFALFDGDTTTIRKKKQVKDRLIEQVTLSDDHVLALKKNSIEDYLLIPTAIGRAFPLVSKSVEYVDAFLKTRKTRRNKKEVLRALFSQLGLGKYDYKKAMSIASEIRLSEIDEEIRRIFDIIVKRAQNTYHQELAE